MNPFWRLFISLGVAGGLALLGGGAGPGCAGLGQEKESKRHYTLALHPLAPAGEPDSALIQTMPTDTGKTIRVRTAAFLTSTNITGAVFRSAQGKAPAALDLTLDAHGRFLWLQALGEVNGVPVAVFVDDWFRFVIRLPPPTGGDAPLTLEGAWTPDEGAGVAAQAGKNYKRLNGK